MGLGSTTDRSAGETILATFWNEIHAIINGDFVGRNTSGVPTASQNLGTAAYPWGTVRADTLVLAGAAVDASQITRTQNVVTSGKKRTTSNQPAFITPNGAALSFILYGATTNLVLDISGTAVTVNTDITKSSLTAAAAANHTALVNDTDAAGQADTRLWGEPEHRKVITIDTIGTNITALDGKYAAFKIGAEYFTALVDTSNNRLIKCRRGYFYDASLNPLNRVVFSNNDTITLMKLGWIFVENNSTTVDVTYTVPHIDFEAPSGPATGDYWYDMSNNLWKRYDGATFQIINRTLVGQFVNNNTQCIAARCEPFFAKYTDENTLNLEVKSTEIVRASKHGARVNVAGTNLNFGKSLPDWNITTELAAAVDMYNAAEQASTVYYLYLKDTGATVISDISPYFMQEKFGQYHPHNPWRCVGRAYNDGSSDIVTASDLTVDALNQIFLQDSDGVGATNTYIRIFSNQIQNYGTDIVYTTSAALGAALTCTNPGKYSIDYMDAGTSAISFGISLNSTELTTAIAGITAADRIASTVTPGANLWAATAATINLLIGDVIRPHVDATGHSASTAGQILRMTRVR